MDKENSNKSSGININDGHIKTIGLLFLIYFVTNSQKTSSRLSLKNLDEVELRKKSMLLNRIKGYMDTEEQLVVHRAEIILQILGRLKLIFEPPQLHSAEVKYNSLSLEDRRRNMLMDLSQHLEKDKRDMIHSAIDLDIKTRSIGKKMQEFNEVTKNGISIDSVEKAVELFEPLLEGELKEKTKDLRKITSILKIFKSVEEKGTLDETDLVEMIAPYVEPEQRKTMMKMMEIAKAVSGSMQTDEMKSESEEKKPTPEEKKSEESQENNENPFEFLMAKKE
ncbi:MAG: hypothetical protein JJT76_17120 [Clostridiaceae bacterium]|nr:hypothetical protein [Clostridiaceae bacterium]